MTGRRSFRILSQPKRRLSRRAAFLPACGDDTTSPESLSPRISNLRFSPEFFYATDFTGEGFAISGTIDFTDADGDLAVGGTAATMTSP